MGGAGVKARPVTGYAADITVWCAACGERFRWIGLPAGSLHDRPAVSIDEYELTGAHPARVD